MQDKFELFDLTYEERREIYKEAYKDVIRERMAYNMGADKKDSGDAPRNPSLHLEIDPESYRDIEKRVSIRLYLERVGRPVTFIELIEAMRAGGMKLPQKDGQAYRLLAIVVRQNAGWDGKREWPNIFYREGKVDRPEIDDKVGLKIWQKSKD